MQDSSKNTADLLLRRRREEEELFEQVARMLRLRATMNAAPAGSGPANGDCFNEYTVGCYVENYFE